MKSLPVHPNLEHLRREAKALKSRHRKGDPGVCSIIGHYDTSLHCLSNRHLLDTRFSIPDAQRVVARQYGFSSWTRIKRFVELCTTGKTPSDPALRHYILERYSVLQNLQRDVKNKTIKYRHYQQETLNSTRELTRAYHRHGWPGPDVVGPDCVDATWFVAASAVYDCEFQHSTINVASTALPDGKLPARAWAGAKDRYLTLKKQPTLYGMAFGAYYDSNGEFQLCIPAIADPDNVDKRRALVGYNSLQDQRARCAADARKHKWQYGTRADAIAELNRISTEGGYT